MLCAQTIRNITVHLMNIGYIIVMVAVIMSSKDMLVLDWWFNNYCYNDVRRYIRAAVNEWGFKPFLCTYILNRVRRDSWRWWGESDDTTIQTQYANFERRQSKAAVERDRYIFFLTWILRVEDELLNSGVVVLTTSPKPYFLLGHHIHE